MARPKYPSDEVDKTMLRFPPGLMSRIKEAAAANNRSMNAEIIDRLQRTVSEDEAEGKFEPEYLERLFLEHQAAQQAAQARALQEQKAALEQMEKRILQQMEKALLGPITRKPSSSDD